MKDQSTLIHLEYESDKNYDTVIAAFEAATGTITGDEFRQAVAASGGNLASFEARIRAFEGSSAFMRFLDVDHSAWMKIFGIPGRSRLYVLGNPLIAATMARHDLGAGLNVPVRVLIYEKPNSGRTWLAYDLPSSLMARLGNNEIDKAAIKLDEKLAALAEIATEAKP
jgi:uncharacterized protein (DUF302 family)